MSTLTQNRPPSTPELRCLDALPPHDPEAEAGSLACILIADAGEAERMLDQLSVDHFYELPNRVVFATLRRLRLDNKPLDSVSLVQWLRDKGKVEDAGGMDYLTALPDKTPSPANFPTYLEAVQDRATRRVVLRDVTDLSRLATDTTIPAAIIADAARRMLESHSRNGYLPELIDAAGFIAEQIPQPVEIVRGILHKGSKLAFGGSSKSFKTWSLLDLAISVATGADWLGHPTAQGKVLFVNFEIQPHSWQKRIAAVARAKGVQLQPGMVQLWNLRGFAADFRQLIPRIVERCRRENFALIVLDPIYKLYGGTDENAAGDVAALLNEIERLATSTGAAVAFGAHFAKGNASAKEAIDRISGSGVFARDPDSLLIFTKHEADDAFTIEPILRNFAPIEPFAVRWQFPLMHRDNTLDPSRLKQACGRKPLYAPSDLLEILPPEGLSNAHWIARAAEEGMSRPTFFRLRKALENDGKTLQSTVSGKWQPILTR